MDSAQKISNCIRAAARDVALEPPSDLAAKSIIGLGLIEAMHRLFPNLTPAQVTALVEAYKYHFVTGDSTEQALFEGVEKGLRRITATGAVVAVATGKSRVGLDRAFDVTGLAEHFIYTRCADESRSKPHPQMLHDILDFTSIEPAKAIMIGDTTFDMEMAHNANIAGLGVAYGVHSEASLMQANALSVMSSFDHVIDWLSDEKLDRAYA